MRGIVERIYSDLDDGDGEVDDLGLEGSDCLVSVIVTY